MKYILIFLLFCFSKIYSQKFEIITTKDSLVFYFEKFRESKSIATTKISSMRVSYIYLDGSKLSSKRISELRNEILNNFRNGEKFSDLATKYTMDGNKNGDLGWFEEGMMVKDFETAVKVHKKGDVFTVDIKDSNWYYVVLKTFDDIEKVKMIIEN